MVTPPGRTWWWSSPHQDGGFSRGDLVVPVPCRDGGSSSSGTLVVDTTTDVLSPAHPCRDVLVRIVGVFNVTGGVEGGGGHPWLPKKDVPRSSGTWGSHIPAINPPQLKRTELQRNYIRHKGTRSLGTIPTCNQGQTSWSNWYQGRQGLGRLGPAPAPRKPSSSNRSLDKARVTEIFLPRC